MILDPQTCIGDSLETVFNLRTYLDIISAVQRGGFADNLEFRKKFNGYFKIRQRSSAWYDQYYALMEEQLCSKRSFRDLLICLEPVCGTIDVSFVSKMMAAVNPSLPIWDRYVLRNLGLFKRWDSQNGKDKKLRIDEAEKIYKKITEQYKAFIRGKDGKAYIAAFDAALPRYKDKLTSVKKLDFFLWSKRLMGE